MIIHERNFLQFVWVIGLHANLASLIRIKYKDYYHISAEHRGMRFNCQATFIFTNWTTRETFATGQDFKVTIEAERHARIAYRTVQSVSWITLNTVKYSSKISLSNSASGSFD